MKTCTKCGEEKVLEAFGKNKYAPDGRRADCRECCRARNRRWREANPEKHRRWQEENPEKYLGAIRKWQDENREVLSEGRRRYREQNPEIVCAREREKRHQRRAKTPYSPELASLMAALLKQPCAYCGAASRITIDHVVPLSRGGKHEANNLAPACHSCNSSKRDNLLEEWTGRIKVDIEAP